MMKRSPRPLLPDGLAGELRTASTRRLLELVGEHARGFTLRELRQTLLNPFVTSAVIEELATARHLLSTYDARRAIARHRRAPEHLAQRFVPGLLWRDLMEITLDVHLAPPLRQMAEKYLIQRLGRLTLGEKINLARRAVPSVLGHLRQEPHPRVIAALLENSRATEMVVLRVATDARSPRVLDVVARHPRWGRVYSVKCALSRNPATPYRALFEILPELLHDDLAAVAVREEHSSIVRQRARELLEEHPGNRAAEVETWHL